MQSSLMFLLILTGIVLQFGNVHSLVMDGSNFDWSAAGQSKYDDYSSYYFQKLIDTYSKTAREYNSVSKTSDIRCLMCNRDDSIIRNEVIDILSQFDDTDLQTFISLIFKNPIKESAKKMMDSISGDSQFELVQELEQISLFHQKMGNINFSKVMDYFFGVKRTSEEYLDDQVKYIEHHLKAQDILEWIPHYFAEEQMPVPSVEQMSGHVELVKQIEKSNLARNNDELLNDRCIEDMKGKSLETAKVIEEFDIHLTSSSSDRYKPPILDKYQYATMKSSATAEIISDFIQCYPLKKRNGEERAKELIEILKIYIASYENKNNDQNDDDEDLDDNEKLMQAVKAIYAFCDYQDTLQKPSNKMDKDVFEKNNKACENITEYTGEYVAIMNDEWDKILAFYECKLNISVGYNCYAIEQSITKFFEKEDRKISNNYKRNQDKMYSYYKKLADSIEKMNIIGGGPRKVGKFDSSIGKIKMEGNAWRLLKIYAKTFSKLSEMPENIANTLMSAEWSGLADAKKLGENLTKSLIAPFLVMRENSVSKEESSKLHSLLYILTNSFRKYILDIDFDRSSFTTQNYRTGYKQSLCKAYNADTIKKIGSLMLGINDFESPSDDEDDQDRLLNLKYTANQLLPLFKRNIVFDLPARLERNEKKIPYEILGVIVKAAEKANPINKLEIEKSMPWANGNIAIYVKDTPKAMFDTSATIIRGCTLAEKERKVSISCHGINDRWVLATLKRLDELGYGKKETELTLDSVALTALPGFVSEWNIKTLILNSVLLPINGPNDIPSKVENIGIKELPANLRRIRRGSNFLMLCNRDSKTYEELRECATNPAKFNVKQKMQRVNIGWDPQESVVFEIFKMKTLPSGDFNRKYTSPIPAQVTLDLGKSKFKRVELMNVLANIRTGQGMGQSLTEFIYNSLWSLTHREICNEPRKIFHDRETKPLTVWNYKSCICNPEVATYDDSGDDGPQDDRLEALKMFLKVYGEHILKTALACLVAYLIVQIMTYQPPSIPNDLRSYENGSNYGDHNYQLRLEYLYMKSQNYIQRQGINEDDIKQCAEEAENEAVQRKLGEAIASHLYRQKEAYNVND